MHYKQQAAVHYIPMVSARYRSTLVPADMKVILSLSMCHTLYSVLIVLRANTFLVDLVGIILVDTQTYHAVLLLRSTSIAPHLDVLSVGDSYLKVLSEYPEITTPTFSSPTAKHGIEYYISTTGAPVSSQI